MSYWRNWCKSELVLFGQLHAPSKPGSDYNARPGVALRCVAQLCSATQRFLFASSQYMKQTYMRQRTPARNTAYSPPLHTTPHRVQWCTREADVTIFVSFWSSQCFYADEEAGDVTDPFGCSKFLPGVGHNACITTWFKRYDCGTPNHTLDTLECPERGSMNCSVW